LRLRTGNRSVQRHGVDARRGDDDCIGKWEGVGCAAQLYSLAWQKLSWTSVVNAE
jgi:hypothetical protein